MSSAATDPTTAFFASMRASGLLQSSQLKELGAWVGTARPDVQGLAREVNRRGWLTAFQIKEIFKGRGRELALGPYVFLDLLGEGGMGRVYKARHTRLGREVAVKVIRKEKLKHPAAEERFRHEVEALGKMEHPNVVKVYNADQVGDTHYYEMEFIDGTDLTKLVRERGPMPIPDACEYIRQAALGLHHAFERGLVHRDIKPSNIIVSRSGIVKLVDLGLARLMENEQANAGRVTQEGFVIGTPDFLAPEQARNPMNVDIRADIYALGGTLYYCLTGKVPYDGANPTEKLLKHCTEPPPGLLLQRMDAPPVLEQFVHWCMAKSADARPQTPMQLALALQPFCPAVKPAAGTAAPNRQPVAAATALPPPGHAAAPQGYAHPINAQAPAHEPPKSSVIFRLPSQTTSNDPIRRRADGGFSWSYLLVALGGLLVASILGYGIYLQFLRPAEKPIESFTTSPSSGSIKMVNLEGGKFLMGTAGKKTGSEGPQHEVTIRGPLLISATEISHNQFISVMKSSPTKSADTAHRAQHRPVEWVSWDEASEFCRKLTEAEKYQPWARKGWAFRLPTEAEWEYAARAGTDTPFASGEEILFEKQALFRPTENDALGKLPPEYDPLVLPKEPRFPQEVGKTEPNAFGLHDMHGNVAEWCLDWYKPGYAESAGENPTGPADGDKRVVRGGSFRTPAADTRSAARAAMRPNERRDDVGFRIVYAPIQK